MGIQRASKTGVSNSYASEGHILKKNRKSLSQVATKYLLHPVFIPSRCNFEELAYYLAYYNQAKPF